MLNIWLDYPAVRRVPLPPRKAGIIRSPGYLYTVDQTSDAEVREKQIETLFEAHQWDAVLPLLQKRCSA